MVLEIELTMRNEMHDTTLRTEYCQITILGYYPVDEYYISLLVLHRSENIVHSHHGHMILR